MSLRSARDLDSNGKGAQPRPRKRIVHISSAHRADDVRIWRKQCCSLVEDGFDVAFTVPHECDDTFKGVQILAVEPIRTRPKHAHKVVAESPRSSIGALVRTILKAATLLAAVAGVFAFGYFCQKWIPDDSPLQTVTNIFPPAAVLLCIAFVFRRQITAFRRRLIRRARAGLRAITRILPLLRRSVLLRLLRRFRTTCRLCQRALSYHADLYHLHDPELMPIAWYLKLRGRIVVLDFHENTPQRLLYRRWVGPIMRYPMFCFVYILEYITAQAVDIVVAATPVIAKRFPTRKTIVVRNYPIIHELARIDATPYERRPAHLAYVGGLTDIRGAREMVRAMELIRCTSDARLKLAGNIGPQTLLTELASQEGWKHVDALGYLQRAEVSDLLNNVRCGLVVLQPTLNYIDTIPTKLLEYMAVGIPFVASDFGPWRKLAGGHQAGIFVNPLDTNEIAQAIERILSHPQEAQEMGERGRAAANKYFNWQREYETLSSSYNQLLC